MKKFKATNEEITERILLRYLGLTYDDLAPEIKENIIKAFGLKFDQMYFEGQSGITYIKNT